MIHATELASKPGHLEGKGDAAMNRSERSKPSLSRRELFRLASAGAVGASASGWIETLAASANPKRRKSCILLWMTGGPSQTDTFDPKPGHSHGGPFKAIETAAPGVRISEHLPRLAGQMKDIAIVRSMSTKEGDHGRATFNLRTGYQPQGPIHYPTFGSLVAKEFEDDSAELPGFVSVSPYRAFNPAAFSAGFLGPKYAPLIVGERGVLGGQGNGNLSLKVDDLAPPGDVDLARADARLGLRDLLAKDFLGTRPGASPLSHQDAYQRAVKMMRSPAAKAFELEEESAEVRDAYGRNPFGQGCLLARRLVERGVPFVEVTLSAADGSMAFGWDTHQKNFDAVAKLSQVLDPAWATLMTDLRSRGLLDSTLIVWMGEFGRTPKINKDAGRDHFPAAWTTVLAGGGIKGGQAVGDTGPDGMTVKDRPVAVPDLLATVCRTLGIDPAAQNVSDVGRPIRVVDPKARPIGEILG